LTRSDTAAGEDLIDSARKTDFPKRRRRSIRHGLWLIPLVAAAVGAWRWSFDETPPGRPPARVAAPVTWVDESRCEPCHAREYGAWQGSHHQLAMRPAAPDSVLGDFGNRSLRTDVETSRFSRSGSGFSIRTPGPDGRPADYAVAYTLGVEPLQQYLLALPDGRLQAHGAAWDVPGKRWFHLYDGEAVDHRHRLHWTAAQQNADFMCIECHATRFRRGYDATGGTYDSQWHAPGVGCQSCHGPASAHLRWAEGGARAASGGKGFATSPSGADEPQTCARCHSRRTPLGNGYRHGDELLDDYLPMILTADLYEVDGKIQGEVFEYGSFRQSRMNAVGVVCSDCHDPHGARLRATGNALCTRCHGPAATAIRAEIDGSGLQAKNYDDPSHHHHAPGSPGSACVDCHMPGKVYMGNDLRRDHSFSSPHPAQALALSHSDACLGCHGKDEALDAFRRWYPGAEPRDGGYARDLHAARRGSPGAAEGLLRQLARADLPDIRRATLLSELPRYPSSDAQRTLAGALRDASPLVRRTAAEQLEALFSPAERVRLLSPLLGDPSRAVRLAAAWQLVQLPSAPGADPRARQQLTAEYEQVQNQMLDRAESNYDLAGVYQATGRQALVEPALRRALRQDPAFHPASILLAQWREQAAGDADGALRLLQDAIARYPAEGSLWHALGLTYVRQGKRDRALQALRRAHELAPEEPDFGYVLAVALHDGGQTQAAVDLLRDVVRQHPAHRAARQVLIGYLRAAGERAEVESLLAALARQNPGDPLLGLPGNTPTR